MQNSLRLLAVMAHPDDETLGIGGVLARYAHEGVQSYLVTATRGELGWPWEDKPYPGPKELGRIREAELRCAAEKLGLQEVIVLDYVDGSLGNVDQLVAARIVADLIRKIQPQIVVTFDPYGVYGHPDHIAICQIASSAVLLAGSQPGSSGLMPHQVTKLYYFVETHDSINRYESVFGEITMQVGDTLRKGIAWEDWAVTAQLDCSAYWQQVWQAVECHRSQVPGIQAMLDLPKTDQQALWSTYSFYRVFSLVNHNIKQEQDLFEGLRE